MYVVREVLSCRPGKVGELKKKFVALGDVLDRLGYPRMRLLTDFAGLPFWTLVAESEAESIEAFEQMENRVMAETDAQQIMAGYHDLIASGRREIYRVQG